MPIRTRIKRGLNIPISGAPKQVITPGNPVRRVALLGEDFVGLKPRMRVQVGDEVALGDPLFEDKHDSAVRFTAPGGGRVVEINRGRRRVLQSVVIELDDAAQPERTFASHQPAALNAIGPDKVREQLLASGAWVAFRARPFNRVPASTAQPASIFVTAIDTRPLAADPRVVIDDQRDAFVAGMRVISQLTEGAVYLCTGPDWSGPDIHLGRLRHAEFEGPHPAGLPGTHIHFLDPVGADRSVWHIGYQDVIAIGHLFVSGRISNKRVVALGGPGVVAPRLIRSWKGALTGDIVKGELQPGVRCRVISGSVLSGRIAAGPTGYLGPYQSQVSVVPENGQRRLFGWARIRSEAYSFAGLLMSSDNPRRQQLNTSRHGRLAAMIPVGAFDRVMPLDILASPLLRALIVRDTDAAQALGCLELAEEDLALSSFVCPAKQNYGHALRRNLEQIEKEG
ncbi:MAG: Na(+)-translocating NADH-quinone reductase subunit A [Gammaproteobacteria bacterium]